MGKSVSWLPGLVRSVARWLSSLVLETVKNTVMKQSSRNTIKKALTHVFTALSREQKEKIYVTHRLAQNMELIYDLIHEKNGNLYLCGPGGNVPPQVRQAVIDSIAETGGHGKEYAEKYVTDMQINGRYNVEAW